MVTENTPYRNKKYIVEDIRFDSKFKTDDEIKELFTHKNVNIRRGSDGNIDTIMPPRYDLAYKDYEFQKK